MIYNKEKSVCQARKKFEIYEYYDKIVRKQ